MMTASSSPPSNMLLLVLFSIVVAASSASASSPRCGFRSEGIDPSEFKFSEQVPNVGHLYWNVLFEDATSQVASAVCIGVVSLPGIQGWIGLGVSDSPGMIPAGVVVGAVGAGGQLSISTREALQYDSAQVMPTTTFTIFEGQLASIGGSLQLQFGREIENGKYPIQRNVMQAMTMAGFTTAPGIQPDLQLDFHNDNRNPFQVNFLSGAFNSGPSESGLRLEKMKVAHGALMTVAWGFLVPLAAILARFKWRAWWFPSHWGLMIIALICNMIAFGLIVDVTSEQGQEQFPTNIGPHPVMGLTVVIGIVLNPLIGWWADRVFDKKRHQTPVVPDGIHAFLGWSLYALAQATTVLGFLLFLGGYDTAKKNPWFWVALAVMAVMFALALVLAISGFAKSKFSGGATRGTRHLQEPKHEKIGLLDSNVSLLAKQALGH